MKSLFKTLSVNQFLDAIDKEENNESIFTLEILHPIKYSNTLEKKIIYFIKSWFQSIVGEAIQSDSQHTWFNFSPIHIESSPNLLVQAPIYFRVLEFIPKIRWILE
jgi:hypothetical protein